MLDCPRCGLRGDYIPKGPKNPGRPINPRKIPEGEFHQCGTPTGDDIQSGPFYCGERAVTVADDTKHPNAFYYVCKRHEKGFLRRIREAEEEEETDRRRETERNEREAAKRAEADLWDAH